MEYSHFAEGFYCPKCGSYTAIIIIGWNICRCMGCFQLYKVQLYKGGNDWAETSHQYAWQPAYITSSKHPEEIAEL